MFAELSITSNFTFLTGASHPEEYIDRAGLFGLSAIAIADENSVAGIVRAWQKGREIARQVAERRAAEAAHGPIGPPRPAHIPPPPSADITCVPRLIPAAKLVLSCGLSVTALPRDRAAWGRLCRLLSRGRLRAEKGQCLLHLDDLIEWGAGMELLLHPGSAADWQAKARRLARHHAGALSLLAAPRYDGADAPRFARLAAEARALGLPLLASAAPLMHHGRRRRLADVLTAVRLGRRVEALGRAALANAEQRLRSEAEMRRLFEAHPEAVDHAAVVAARCRFDLGQLRYEYPSEVSGGESASERLSRLAHKGCAGATPRAPRPGCARSSPMSSPSSPS